MLDVHSVGTIHVGYVWECLMSFHGSVQQECPVSGVNLLKGWAWSVRSQPAALPIIWTLHTKPASVWKKKGRGETFTIGRQKESFHVTYTCLWIGVNALLCPNVWMRLTADQYKIMDKLVSRYICVKNQNLTSQRVNQIKNVRLNNGDPLDLSYGTLSPPCVQWVWPRTNILKCFIYKSHIIQCSGIASKSYCFQDIWMKRQLTLQRNILIYIRLGQKI